MRLSKYTGLYAQSENFDGLQETDYMSTWCFFSMLLGFGLVAWSGEFETEHFNLYPAVVLIFNERHSQWSYRSHIRTKSALRAVWQGLVFSYNNALRIDRVVSRAIKMHPAHMNLLHWCWTNCQIRIWGGASLNSWIFLIAPDMTLVLDRVSS